MSHELTYKHTKEKLTLDTLREYLTSNVYSLSHE